MMPTATSLTMLQLSDSGFPSGALSFSSGVERLSADGLLT
jgi:urease accessory protein UreF